MREIRVGLLGLGNVGAGVVRLLSENAKTIEARLGAKLMVAGAVVRDIEKPRLVDIDSALVSTDADALVARDDLDIVCELFGGQERARELVAASLEHGKHVVTANKAMLAVHGEELFSCADRCGRELFYEAAVCGGIPIIRALREGLASDRIDSITAIVNGTSNYITTAMSEGGRSYAEVLKAAQEAGFAEADPTLDVGGGDAAHKLAILAMLSFGARVRLEDIHVEGIDTLEARDYELAAGFGYTVKPLAIARRCDGSLDLRVHPALVPARWLLADVAGAKNAVHVDSYALGPSMYYGAGAGMMPTAMSVVSDLIEVAKGLLRDVPAGSSRPALQRIPIRPMAKLESRYYLRFPVVDRAGVLGKLTTTLGHSGVSISELLQPKHDKGGSVSIVALTHRTTEGAVQKALREIGNLQLVERAPTLLRIAADP